MSRHNKLTGLNLVASWYEVHVTVHLYSNSNRLSPVDADGFNNLVRPTTGQVVTNMLATTLFQLDGITRSLQLVRLDLPWTIVLHDCSYWWMWFCHKLRAYCNISGRTVNSNCPVKTWLHAPRWTTRPRRVHDVWDHWLCSQLSLHTTGLTLPTAFAISRHGQLLLPQSGVTPDWVQTDSGHTHPYLYAAIVLAWQGPNW